MHVCVSGLSDAQPHSDGDLIAAFAPADAPFNATAPVKVRRTHVCVDEVGVSCHWLGSLFTDGRPACAPQLQYLNESRRGGNAGGDRPCLRFHLLNLRDTYAFALLRGGPQAPVRAA